jgi:hypothetical protein
MSTFPVDFVFFVKPRTSTSSVSSRRPRPPLVADTEEEVSDLGTSSTSVVTTGTAASAPNPAVTLKSVWDFEKIEKRGGPDVFSKYWHCGWCGLTLRGWNATKALNHVSKAAGNNDVKACTGPIPLNTLALFQSFRHEKSGAASVKRRFKDAFADSVSVNQLDLSVMLESSRIRSSKSSSSRPIDMTDDAKMPGDGVGAKNS